jgi:hypothetical protein
MTPGISKFFYMKMKMYPPIWRNFFHYQDMDTAYVERQGMVNYGLPFKRFPGEIIRGMQFAEDFNVRYVPDMYSGGDSIPKEDLMRDMYRVLHQMLPRMGGNFADMYMTLIDLQLANLLINFGFAAVSPYGPDGVGLFSTNHPISRQQPTVKWANTPYVPVDASVAAYNAAYTNIVSLQNAPNNIMIIRNKPEGVVFHPSQVTIWTQIARGFWQPDSANRNENRIPKDNLKLNEWPYFKLSGTNGALTTPPSYNAWMVYGQDHYLNFFMREPFNVDSDSDITVRSQLFAAHMEIAYGWDSARGLYASPGY